MALRFALVDLESALPSSTSPLLMPRHGVLSVATAASRSGHSVEVWVECLNGLDKTRLERADVVGFAVTRPNLSRVVELIRHLRQTSPNCHLIAGGPHPTLSPREMLDHVDVVVRDEAEDTIVELLNALETDVDLEAIEGISFMRDGRAIHNPRRAYRTGGISDEDLSLITGFDLESRKAQMKRGEVLCAYITGSRGCPFPCTFCYENMIGGTGYRRRDIPSLIEDIKRKKKFFGTDRFWFSDSNFDTHHNYTREVLQAIIDADLGCKFSLLSRVDIGTRLDLLDLMRDAGVVEVSIGMEAIEDERLASIEKRQTVDAIIRTVDELLAREMTIHGLFMLGFDGDTEATPWKLTEFCKKHGVHDINLYLLGEYPELPGRTLPRYRICETDPDYHSGHFVTTFPRDVRPSLLEDQAYESLTAFYDPRKARSSKHLAGRLDIRAAQYLQVRRMARVSAAHQERLRELEAPYYGADGRLREDLLRANPIVNHPLPSDTWADWKDPSEHGSEGSQESEPAPKAK